MCFWSVSRGGRAIVQSNSEPETIASIARAANRVRRIPFEGIVMDLVGFVRLNLRCFGAKALKEKDPAIRLQLAARIACQIHDAQRAEFSLLRSAGITTPAVAALEEEFASSRSEARAELIESTGAFRPVAAASQKERCLG